MHLFLQRIESKLDLVLRYLQLILLKENTMATKADFDALHDDVVASIAAVQARIDDLTAKINAGGMTADEENAALAEMQDLQAKIKAVATPPSA